MYGLGGIRSHSLPIGSLVSESPVGQVDRQVSRMWVYAEVRKSRIYLFP